MLKIPFTHAAVDLSTHFYREGSVLKGDATVGLSEVVCSVNITSDEPAERVQHLIRMAEQTCFVLQSLQQPVPVTTEVKLNGRDLALE